MRSASALALLPFALLLVTPAAMPEPPECSGTVDVNCIHYHQGLYVNLDTGEMYWFSVMEFCGSYLDAGEYHHGDPCQHFPTERVLGAVTPIDVRLPPDLLA